MFTNQMYSTSTTRLDLSREKTFIVWEEKLEKAGAAEDLETAMIRRYPQRWNRYILEVACKGTV
jgi:hypothetical protein